MHREPKDLLAACGFTVKEVPEAHLCCGSAGTYNILQPEIAGRLRDRKIANIEKTEPDVIAAGNIGCITQIASGTAIPVVHPVELIDWATGGPVPGAFEGACQCVSPQQGERHGQEAEGEEEVLKAKVKAKKRATPARRKKVKAQAGAAKKPRAKTKARAKSKAKIQARRTQDSAPPRQRTSRRGR